MAIKFDNTLLDQYIGISYNKIKTASGYSHLTDSNLKLLDFIYGAVVSVHVIVVS